MAKGFIKVKEDFVCEKCGTEVKGNGFTNHCTKCLWSKHVDTTPGGRASECHGLMEPIDVVAKKGGSFSVIHRCILCGHEKRNEVSLSDDFDVIADIARRSAEKKLSKNKQG